MKYIVQRHNSTISAVAEHAWSKHQQPFQKETRILDCTTTLLIKEPMHISLRHSKKPWNSGQSLDIDYCWKNPIRKNYHAGSRTREQRTEQSEGVRSSWRHLMIHVLYDVTKQYFFSLANQCSCKYFIVRSHSGALLQCILWRPQPHGQNVSNNECESVC